MAMNTLNPFDAGKKIDLREIVRGGSPSVEAHDPRVFANQASRGSVAGLRQIRANELQVDHTYQRPVGMTFVNRIAKAFDPSLFGIVTVSERSDGSLYVLDGQHRVAAMVKLGKGDTRIPCEVLTGLSRQEEAEVFHLRNSNKKSMSPQEKFRGAWMSGDARVISIVNTVRSCGYEINLDTSELYGGKIPAIAALRYVDRQYREGHLGDTLALIAKTWGREVGPRGNLIKGMAYFLFLYRDDVSEKRFITQLSQVGLDQIYREGKEHRLATGASTDVSIASVLVRRYNYRLAETNKIQPVEVKRAINAMKESERGN